MSLSKVLDLAHSNFDCTESLLGSNRTKYREAYELKIQVNQT